MQPEAGLFPVDLFAIMMPYSRRRPEAPAARHDML